MIGFVPYFLGFVGLLVSTIGLYYIFASKQNIEKLIKWMYSFSAIEPRKSIKGRPLKAMRFNGVLMLMVGIFVVYLGIYVYGQLQSMLGPY